MRLSRLFGIVHLLIEKKCMPAKDIAARFEVSVRTIYRDVDALSTAGIPVYAIQGKGGGICIHDRYVLNKTILSEKEQTQILTALHSISAAQHDGTEKVLSKLSSLFQMTDTSWIEFDFSGWMQNGYEKTKFEMLKEAVLSCKTVAFSYSNTKGEQSHRTAEPLRLVFKGHSWYLYAYCRKRMDYRFFKLTRLNELQIKDEVYARVAPPPVCIPAYDYETINLVLKFKPEIAYRVYDEFSAVEKCTDGSLIVRQKMSKDEWLIGYILSFGAQVEVLEPKSIRDMIATQIKLFNICYKT